MPVILTSADSHQTQRASVGLALGMLIGLTTLAVAWVSVWWVPGYLALDLVFIYVAPRGRGQTELVIGSSEPSTETLWADLGNDLKADQANEVDDNHLASLVPGLITGETPIEPQMSSIDLASSGITKPRRRVRVRKAAKAALSRYLKQLL